MLLATTPTLLLLPLLLLAWLNRLLMGMLLRYPDADWALGRADPAAGMVAERYWKPLLTGSGDEERVGAGMVSPAVGCCAMEGLGS